MAVIEVVCPNPACGARLKAPEDRAGKKAKCNKCGEGFRVPGPVPMAESVEEPVLSSMALPAPALPEPPKAKLATPAPPVKNLADLPSADPFDFAAPAKPAFGSGAPAKPAPKAAPPAPVATAAPAKPSKPAARPAPAEEPVPEADLDEEPPASKPKAKAKKAAEPEPEPVPEPAPADNPFSFGSDEPAEKPKKSRRRAEEEDEDEDERPRKKKRDEEGEAEEKPRKKKRDEESEEDTKAAEPAPAGNPFSFGFGDEPEPEKPKKSKRRDEEDEDKPRKKKRATDDDEEDEKPRKKKRDEEEDEEADAKAKQSEPEPAPAGNPFSFGGSDEPEPEKPKKSRRRADEDEDEEDKPRKKKRDEEEDEDKPRKKKRATDDDEEDEKPRKKKRAADDEGEEEGADKPRYQRREEKGGMGKALMLSAVVALVAIGLAATAGVMYLRSKSTAETKKEEKKEEQPPTVTPPVVTPPVVPKEKGEPKPKDKEPEPKPKDKEPEPKPKDKEPEAAPARPSVVLDGKFRSVTVGKEPAKFERADQPGEPRFTVDAPFASVVQVFPPFDPKASDAYVVTRTGVRYSLDAYSPSSGARVSRLEFAADPKPLCDVFATATDARFLAVSAGRVTVWKLADRTKLADAVDPYADKPAHAKNGLAAVYFSPNPEQIVTVSTAGAVHLFDLGTKTVVAEFVPPHGVKGAVTQGESVTRFGAESLALAVGGIVYQIKSADLTRARTHDLGGDVKPLAIASAGAAGRLAFAFEAEFKGKKEKERALLVLPLQGDRRDIFLLPAATGTPKGAFWVHDTDVGIVTERGVVWFGEDEGKFGPVVVTRPAADALYAGSGGFFWLLVPRPTNAAQSFLVPLAVPFGDAAEFRGAGAGKPLRVVRIDQNGLAK